MPFIHSSFAWFPYASYARIQASRHRKIVELLVVTSVSGRRFSCSRLLFLQFALAKEDMLLQRFRDSAQEVAVILARTCTVFKMAQKIDWQEQTPLNSELSSSYYGSSFRILSHMSHPFCGPSFRFAGSASWVVPARTRSKEFLHSCGRRADGTWWNHWRTKETFREDNS